MNKILDYLTWSMIIASTILFLIIDIYLAALVIGLIISTTLICAVVSTVSEEFPDRFKRSKLKRMLRRFSKSN